MSNTELVNVAVPQPATLPTVVEDHEETHQRPQDEEGDPSTGRRREQQLAPVDGGSAAWTLLCAAFIFESLLWGKFTSLIKLKFADNRYVSVVGTIASGFGYLGAPVIMPIIQRYQRWQRHMIWVGWSICIAGLVLGSFASTLEGLILTQGVAYGVGFLIFYYPIISMVNEYWIARRGMAYGVLCGASGVSGSVMPFVLQALLAKYGYRTTLRAVAVALALLTGPFIPLLKGRLPPSERASIRKINWTFFRSPLFWVYSVSNLLQGLGYFFPSLYLPSYASSLRLGDRSGALLLALMSSLPVLIFFAIVYGLFGAGFTAIWARMSTAITDDVTSGPIVYTLLNFGKGIGNVLAGPVGGLLVSKPNSTGAPSSVSYRGIIIFTGTCMLASTCIICLRFTKHLSISLARFNVLVMVRGASKFPIYL
ncbi:hypothetical protein J7T55_010592 [Diaporthe amygdali]|uniref:uncharacterized protein n=1 Tax=Phomopsis amygdali TaxID=1214568 RepID=UPI0022FE28A7|nr:uncharacterized protein J7T55_010592 [Diaporthe amygdali]KAJ0115769.1 hypothetical protein J7T55_010592 [Diaporthe amygdali]